ncbi:DUF736 domain-containing protein [Pseudorhizobium flavum]|uniref:DUF736 domain-containing protein n=1 Tax=Pseudorhizobium flavum TaxID=1335061 RepID=UPI002491FE7D|nr:DUF736 domain-containing protein [Pseudorhizobium flavum]
MATLGKFKKAEGGFEGTIEGITTAAAKVRIQPVQAKPNNSAPDYRVFRGEAEVGAAWRKKNREGQRYLVVTLDDPAFSQPIQCRLVPEGESYVLFWTR